MAKLAQEMVDSVFSFGELGMQEVETSRYLTAQLEKFGFKVTRGQSGIPTAWVATYGSGKPVIALGSDIDGIPQASQKPGVAYHDPIIAGAPGHGEGHNTGMPLNIVAAIAVKQIMERDKLPGTLMLWPGVAEELVASKAWFVRDGMFKDVDVNLFTHVGDNLGVSWGQGGGTGLVSVEYTFEGETAHSAGAPWRGRSALDAVELMSIGWKYRREHLRLSQRSHSVITNGGDQPNVVPRNASIWFYFREIDQPHIKELCGDRQQDGRRRGADDQHQGDVAHSRHGVSAALQQGGRRNDVREHQDRRPADVERSRPDARQGAAEGARQRDAERPRREAGRAGQAGAARETTPAAARTTSATSRGTCRPSRCAIRRTSRACPATTGRARIASATPIAHKGVVAGAKVQAMTILDLLTKPELIKGAWDYFNNVQTKDVKYMPFITKRHAAADAPEQGDPREVSRADAEVLLRPDEVPDLSRSAGHQVPDGSPDTSDSSSSNYRRKRRSRVRRHLIKMPSDPCDLLIFCKIS